MIKVILFDLGEVILTNDWHYDCPEKFAAYTDAFGITDDQMENGWKAAWPEYELGTISEDTFWEKFLKEAGAKEIDVEKAKALWKKYFGEKKEMFAVLAELKKKYILAVASSTGKEWLLYKREKYNLDTYFSRYFTTCDLHLKKTDSKFFQRIIQELDVAPSEILMVDDTQKVLDVAASEKMQTIHFDTPDAFTKQLKDLAIL